jgi:hypothetical protein
MAGRMLFLPAELITDEGAVDFILMSLINGKQPIAPAVSA